MAATIPSRVMTAPHQFCEHLIASGVLINCLETELSSASIKRIPPMGQNCHLNWDQTGNCLMKLSQMLLIHFMYISQCIILAKQMLQYSSTLFKNSQDRLKVSFRSLAHQSIHPHTPIQKHCLLTFSVQNCVQEKYSIDWRLVIGIHKIKKVLHRLLLPIAILKPHFISIYRA